MNKQKSPSQSKSSSIPSTPCLHEILILIRQISHEQLKEMLQEWLCQWLREYIKLNENKPLDDELTEVLLVITERGALITRRQQENDFSDIFKKTNLLGLLIILALKDSNRTQTAQAIMSRYKPKPKSDIFSSKRSTSVNHSQSLKQFASSSIISAKDEDQFILSAHLRNILTFSYAKKSSGTSDEMRITIYNTFSRILPMLLHLNVQHQNHSLQSGLLYSRQEKQRANLYGTIRNTQKERIVDISSSSNETDEKLEKNNEILCSILTALSFLCEEAKNKQYFIKLKKMHEDIAPFIHIYCGCQKNQAQSYRFASSCQHAVASVFHALGEACVDSKEIVQYLIQNHSIIKHITDALVGIKLSNAINPSNSLSSLQVSNSNSKLLSTTTPLPINSSTQPSNQRINSFPNVQHTSPQILIEKSLFLMWVMLHDNNDLINKFALSPNIIQQVVNFLKYIPDQNQSLKQLHGKQLSNQLCEYQIEKNQSQIIRIKQRSLCVLMVMEQVTSQPLAEEMVLNMKFAHSLCNLITCAGGYEIDDYVLSWAMCDIALLLMTLIAEVPKTAHEGHTSNRRLAKEVVTQMERTGIVEECNALLFVACNENLKMQALWVLTIKNL